MLLFDLAFKQFGQITGPGSLDGATGGDISEVADNAGINWRDTMSYFRDLSPCAYGSRSHTGVVHVGWLDGEHPYARGPVDPSLVEKMKRLASKPVELYRGLHICELCAEPSNLDKGHLPNRVIDPKSSWAEWIAGRSGNGESRVSRGGTTFAAPVLVVHYIEAHDYLPPEQFLKAVEEAPGR